MSDQIKNKLFKAMFHALVNIKGSHLLCKMSNRDLAFGKLGYVTEIRKLSDVAMSL